MCVCVCVCVRAHVTVYVCAQFFQDILVIITEIHVQSFLTHASTDTMKTNVL